MTNIKTPNDINLDEFESLLEVFEQSCQRFAQEVAFTCMGQTLTYQQLEEKTRYFAAYLQAHTDLKPGDRLAVQLPNTLMFPVTVFGALRAGLIVVNTNPLYSEREMRHQFNDSGAKGLVVLSNRAASVERILPLTCVKHIFIVQMGDLHPFPQRQIINFVVKRIKKLVPKYKLPYAVDFRKALIQGKKGHFMPHKAKQQDLAILQYTGGTTGVAKGAMLSHKNLIANMQQVKAILNQALNQGGETIVAPLPMYHIYTFTVNCMVMMQLGNNSLLIPDPRDISGFVKTLQKNRFTGFVGLNTLFVALCNNEAFQQLDFSQLKVTISGGMALTQSAAEQWKQVTSCEITEGYGLTETSPVVSLNPFGAVQIGTIGKPVPATQVKVVNEAGEELPAGQEGELLIKGPQVMTGYWNKPEETAKALSADGWFASGDVAVIQDDGYIRIVDRKKDMIIVSGFNVYPNEVEDVLAGHPDVLEVAVLGVPDARSGEAVKAFIVARKKLKRKELRRWCRKRLTSYKVPSSIEFRTELPKTNVGKVLRRELRDEAQKKAK